MQTDDATTTLLVVLMLHRGVVPVFTLFIHHHTQSNDNSADLAFGNIDAYFGKNIVAKGLVRVRSDLPTPRGSRTPGAVVGATDRFPARPQLNPAITTPISLYAHDVA